MLQEGVSKEVENVSKELPRWTSPSPEPVIGLQHKGRVLFSDHGQAGGRDTGVGGDIWRDRARKSSGLVLSGLKLIVKCGMNHL